MKTPPPQRAAGRRELAAKKQALPDGSLPIPNVDYLKRAIRSIGRIPPGKRPAAKALIRKRARQLKATSAPGVKGTWPFQGANDAAGGIVLACPRCGARSAGRVVELVGPKGYVHGWIYSTLIPGRAGTLLACEPGRVVELTGPKGWSHGWVFHGPGGEVKTVKVGEFEDAKVSGNLRAAQTLADACKHAAAADRLTAAARYAKEGSAHRQIMSARNAVLAKAASPRGARIGTGGPWRAHAPAPHGGPHLATSKDGESLRRGDKVTVVSGQHAGKTGTVTGSAGTAPGLLMVNGQARGASKYERGENFMVHGKHVKRTGGPALAGGQRQAVELAGHFDPAQPRDAHGRWAHTPSYKTFKASGTPAFRAQRQMASGVWGSWGTYSDYAAGVAKLTPAQKRVFRREVGRTRRPGDALDAALSHGRPQTATGEPPPPQRRRAIFGGRTLDDFVRQAGLCTPAQHQTYVQHAMAGASPGEALHAARGGKAAVNPMNYTSTYGKVIDMATAPATARRMPVVRGAADVQMARTGPGKVTVMHKSTGTKVGTLAQAGKGWQATHTSGQKAPASGTMGGAVAGLIAVHNQLARGGKFPPAQQGGTAVMPAAGPTSAKSYAGQVGDVLDMAGAMPRSTPASSSSDGPRVTAGGGGAAGQLGLSGEAAVVYAKLRKKGLSPKAALAMAKRAAAMHAKAAAKKAA